MRSKFGLMSIIAILSTGFTFFMLTNKRSDTVISVIEAWSPYSGYHVLKERGVDIQNNGTLGSFHSCLSEYRHISTRRISGKLTQNNESLVLKIDSSFILDLAVNNSEVYRMSIERLDEHGKMENYSNNYAINCDLGLLNK